MEIIKNQNKLIHIEIIRIIAAFLVIFNHTGSKGYFLFASYPFGTLPYFIYMSLTVFCKVAVPLFFMISGALLLKKDISIKKIFKTKILKILIVLLIFSAIYYVRLYLLDYSKKFSILDFLARLYQGNIVVPYWYLYAYISFLIALPFLRSMVKSLPKYGYIYLFILSIIFTSMLPCLEYLFSHGNVTLNEYGKISWLFSNIVIYPLIGYYIENIFDIKDIKKKHLLILGIISFIGLCLSCYMTYFKHNITGKCTEVDTQDFLDSFVLLLCLSVYLNIKYFCYKIKIPDKLNKTIISIGSCSFGIYLIHFGIIESSFINTLWEFFTKQIKFNYMFSILFLCLLTMIISYLITFILKKIPYLKKIL